MIVGIFVLVILTVLFIVFLREQWENFINYPKRQVGNKMYGASHHIFL